MKYFARISHSTQPKNNAERQAFDFIKDLNQTLIMDDIDLRQFVENIENQIKQINQNHPRCRDISFSYREYDNYNHAQASVGDFLYITIDYVKNQSNIPAADQIVAMIHDQYVPNPSAIRTLFSYSVVAKVEELLSNPVLKLYKFELAAELPEILFQFLKSLNYNACICGKKPEPDSALKSRVKDFLDNPKRVEYKKEVSCDY